MAVIEISYGCDTCDARHREQWELLQSVKCALLEGLTCPECGETFSLFVEDGP
jgi:DNA-directed RNA polymerase subunit RPC12/RpoP